MPELTPVFQSLLVLAVSALVCVIVGLYINHKINRGLVSDHKPKNKQRHYKKKITRTYFYE